MRSLPFNLMFLSIILSCLTAQAMHNASKNLNEKNITINNTSDYTIILDASYGSDTHLKDRLEPHAMVTYPFDAKTLSSITIFYENTFAQKIGNFLKGAFSFKIPEENEIKKISTQELLESPFIIITFEKGKLGAEGSTALYLLSLTASSEEFLNLKNRTKDQGVKQLAACIEALPEKQSPLKDGLFKLLHGVDDEQNWVNLVAEVRTSLGQNIACSIVNYEQFSRDRISYQQLILNLLYQLRAVGQSQDDSFLFDGFVGNTLRMFLLGSGQSIKNTAINGNMINLSDPLYPEKLISLCFGYIWEKDFFITLNKDQDPAFSTARSKKLSKKDLCSFASARKTTPTYTPPPSTNAQNTKPSPESSYRATPPSAQSTPAVTTMPKEVKDAFTALGLQSDASLEDVKTTYKKQALKYHPDKHPNASAEEKEATETKFKFIKEAYDLLKDYFETHP